MIYLDSCLLIYAIEQDPLYGERVVAKIESVAAEGFAISPLVRMECLVKPVRDADLILQARYEAALGELPSLALVDRVFDLATHLRARFGLRTPDAIHLACAQHHGCEALWTNDGRLAKAGRGLAVDILAT